MRQAGRYHQHYQNIKKNSDFMSMCKNPDLACEVTMGPIQDFNFDAAILFSDLLFPLEFLNMGLTYRNGPPELSFHLNDENNINKIKPIGNATEWFSFQAKACQLIRKNLPETKSLIGFVGAPFTLYTYATEGSHSGNLVASKRGLTNGLFESFYNQLEAPLLEEMNLQAQNGAEAIALFDTAAGELSAQDYNKYIVPKIEKIVKQFKINNPHKKIIYYSKFTHIAHLEAFNHIDIDVLGVDWRFDLSLAFKHFPKLYIQGNIDPIWLHLDQEHMVDNLNQFKKNHWDNIDPARWIFGLGHGVTIQTPEANVKKAVEWVHKELLY
jgi:uroporphyrinogen decarboxylase